MDAKNNIHMSWNQQALQNRTLGTVEWDFFSKAMETGIILSIADMKKQLLRVFKRGPAVVYFQNITETREARILST